MGREGSNDLKKGKDEKLMITQTHIMGRKPSARDNKAHLEDVGLLSEANELIWEEFVQLTTAQEDLYYVPRTFRRRESALVLKECTLPPILREALNTLGIHGIIQQHLEIDSNDNYAWLLGLTSVMLGSDTGVASLL